MIFRILFVCTGNICRSPLAEAVARDRLFQLGKSELVSVDSAGTHGYHSGEPPDPRTCQVASINGISTEGIRARQVKIEDFQNFDLILGMDQGHVQALQQMAPPQYHANIHLFNEFAGQGAVDVPDPYYGDFLGFEQIYTMIECAVSGIESWGFRVKKQSQDI